jgi:tetratricopeptide (TPR) repeat protein
LNEELLANLKAGRWQQTIAAYERELSPQDKQSPEFRTPYAIALFRSGRFASGMKILKSDPPAAAAAREEVRRWVVKHLVDDGSVDRAVEVADVLLEGDPDSIPDLRMRASLLGRLKRREDALADVERVLELDPDETVANTQRLQLLLQLGRVQEAGRHAASILDIASGDPRLAHMALLALSRSEQHESAAILAREAAEMEPVGPTLAGAIVRALFEAGSYDHAIAVGERLLAEGQDDPVLRCFLGEAHLATRSEARFEKAVDHLRAAVALDPSDFRSNVSLGEALLRQGRYEEATGFLRAACEIQPKTAQARALYARGLKQCRRYSEAAVEFKRLLSLQPSSSRWQRYAAGALSQSGRQTEARQLFDSFVAERAARLPRNFEDGLEALWGRVGEVDLPQARLDWAWSLRRDELTNDREEWERRAKWGHLADHYLLDWLECRDDRVHEPMKRLADLGQAESALGAIDLSKGLIIASAHVGPMFAGPLALELLGLPSRWLASTPSVARTAYAKSLISTSDQEDLEIAAAFMRALRQRYAVVIAVDGAINLAAPRIEFEGQEITYSSFAARTAHRLGVPSVFGQPRWVNGKIDFVIRPMPSPAAAKNPDEYAELWRTSFLAALRDYLGGAPENMRLSGGIWRHIR